MDSETRKRTKAVNQQSVQTAVASLILLIGSFIIGIPKSAIPILVSMALIMLIPVFLNLSGRILLSRIVFLLTRLILVMILTLLFGLESHTQFYLITGIGLPLLFFKDEIGFYKWVLAIISIPAFLYLEVHFTYFDPVFELNASTLNKFRLFNDVVVLLVVLGLIANFSKRQTEQHDQDDEIRSLLKLQGQKLELALESSETGFWDYDLLTNELIWDDQMLVLYGVTKENFLGAYEAWSKGLHPDDRERSEHELNEAVAGYAPFDTTFRVVHPDGEIRHIKATGKVLRDVDGKPYRMIGLNWDITQAFEHEKVLSDQKQKLELTLEAGNVGLWEWHIPTNELVWDDQMKNLYGLKGENFSGAYNAWTNGLHPKDKIRSETEIQTAINGGAEFNTKFRVVWPNKEVHHLRATGTVYRNEKGDPIRMVGLNWDVTAEHLANEALKKSNKLIELKNQELNEFAYIASHDLQEPINTMNAFSDLVLKQYAENLDDTGKEYLSYIKGSGLRAKELISDLLDYNRIGTQKELKKINLNVLVNDVAADLAASITANNVRLQLGGLPTVTGYETELRLLLQNLIGNAIKFSKKEGDSWVKVTAKNHANEVEICVEDNGIGIEEKYFDRIFAVFRRLHSKSEYAGTGIGLAHCKKIVEMHKGRIWVNSEYGTGSSFQFTISTQL